MDTYQRLDRRIQRTRQLLQDALFQLITQRSFAGIAIQDITEQANLGRTTFYLHYHDKEELLLASVKTLLRELQLDVEPVTDEVCPYLQRSVRTFRHVAQRWHLYQALLRENGAVNIGDLMRAYFAELYQRFVIQPNNQENLSTLNNDLIAAHAAGSLFGLISWWLNHDVSPSAEQMGAVYHQLMATGGMDVSQQLT